MPQFRFCSVEYCPLYKKTETVWCIRFIECLILGSPRVCSIKNAIHLTGNFDRGTNWISSMLATNLQNTIQGTIWRYWPKEKIYYIYEYILIFTNGTRKIYSKIKFDIFSIPRKNVYGDIGVRNDVVGRLLYTSSL